MKNSSTRALLWFASLFLIVSLACNLGSTPTAGPTSEPEQIVVVETEEATAEKPVEEPTPTEEPPVVVEPESGAVSNLSDVRSAVIQIEAEGTFVDPEVGWMVNVGSRGTGFIIDPSGIAVTNNHVVTGAALLHVYVDGESKPRNARILGVSECSDLAVIDIEGDDLPYLDWYDGNINVGLKVYAAGFPLGDPEFTLTDGIISKEEAGGDTSWASVDYVIEHSAKINPGNSGGPLVTENGQVIGVNYAVVSETDQNFAISREEALDVIEELRAGNDVESIGVNGGAVYGDVGGTPIYGIWVRSVKSGSPADKARVQAGDIIYQLEGEVLATDGTMSSYCDILRSRRATDTMSMTVIRFDDLSLMEGQLNGRELEVTGNFDGTGANTTPDDVYVSDACFMADTAGFIGCVDDTGTIYVEVPDYWLDYNGGQWTYDGEVIGVAISTAPSLDEYNSYWDAEGMFFGASDTFAQIGGYIEFLDWYSWDYRDACKLQGRYDYEDAYYRGKYDYFSNCGGTGGYDAYVLAAIDRVNPTASIIMIMIQVPKGETVTVDQILNTFLVGDL